MSRRSLVILAVSLLAFAGMVVMISVGVTTRRRNRDFTYGLERLQVLIEDGPASEARDLLPWLVERAPDVRAVLSVLKRGLLLGSDPADVAAFARAADAGLNAFAGNATLRSIAAYAAVRHGEPRRALDLTRGYEQSLMDGLHAWVLMSNELRPQPAELDGESDDPEGRLFLASLDRGAAAPDLERAWLATGDWRYAADAALLFLASGRKTNAADLSLGASLALHTPLLAADISLDTGRPERALEALRNAPARGEAPVELRTGDALMALGLLDDAERIYRLAIDAEPSFSPVPYVNLAWIVGSGEDAGALYAEAFRRFPGSWDAAEQNALFLAMEDVTAALDSVTRYEGPLADARQSLLRTRLSPSTDRRGYNAELWSLVQDGPASDDAFRLAAWHFLVSRQLEDLSLLLERAPDASWVPVYRGVLAAFEGDWGSAANQFEDALRRGPSWQTAYNLALSRFAVGEADRAFAALSQAELYALEAGHPPESSVVYLLDARSNPNPVEGYAAAVRALELDPTNVDALILRDSFKVR